MIEILLDKQIFASSDARFCQDTHNDGRNTQNFVRDMRNFSLDMVLSPQYVSMKPSIFLTFGLVVFKICMELNPFHKSELHTMIYQK